MCLPRCLAFVENDHHRPAQDLFHLIKAARFFQIQVQEQGISLNRTRCYFFKPKKTFSLIATFSPLRFK